MALSTKGEEAFADRALYNLRAAIGELPFSHICHVWVGVSPDGEKSGEHPVEAVLHRPQLKKDDTLRTAIHMTRSAEIR